MVLISTSAGELGGVTFGMPQVLVRFRKPLLPLISGAGWVTAGMLDRAREASTDLAWLLTRKYGFGSAKVSPALVSYVERMNSATRTESVARYLRTLYTHDRVMALGAFAEIPVLVMCGDEDLLTPVEHSEAICGALPTPSWWWCPAGATSCCWNTARPSTPCCCRSSRRPADRAVPRRIHGALRSPLALLRSAQHSPNVTDVDVVGGAAVARTRAIAQLSRVLRRREQSNGGEVTHIDGARAGHTG